MTSSTWRSSAVMVALGFAVSGMLTGGLMQADVMAYERAFGLNHERVSFWLSLFSVLTAVGGGCAGYLADRWGAGRIYRVCLFLSAAGLLAFAWTRFVSSTLIGFVSAALGIGGLVVGNILVSNDDTGSPTRSLNHLHASHATARLVGVVLSIFTIGAFWQVSYLILGAIFVCLTAAYMPPSGLAASRGNGQGDESRPVLSLSLVSLAFLLYMTAEMVLVTWLPAYFEQDWAWSARQAKATYVIFLVGLISGRMFCARAWPVEMEKKACAILAVVHLAAIWIFLWAPSVALLNLALFACGFCQGPGWPALFAYAMRRSRGTEGRVTGVVYVVCCAAIVLATSGSGVVAQHMGLKTTFYVVGFAHLGFSVLFYQLLRGPALRD